MTKDPFLSELKGVFRSDDLPSVKSMIESSGLRIDHWAIATGSSVAKLKKCMAGAEGSNEMRRLIYYILKFYVQPDPENGYLRAGMGQPPVDGFPDVVLTTKRKRLDVALPKGWGIV